MPSTLTSNGLQLINLGAYIGDGSSDDIIDYAHKDNANLTILDTQITILTSTTTNLNIAQGRGIVDGFINGGVSPHATV